MPTDADLNAYAAAANYDGMTLHVTDPDADAGATPAAGGSMESIAMGVAGAAGFDPGRYPATVGRRYTSAATFTLTEPAQWVGLWVGSSYRRRAKLRNPIGPGTFPVVAAINIRTP